MQHIYITTEIGVIAKVAIQGNVTESAIAECIAKAFDGIGQIEELGDTLLIDTAWTLSMNEVCTRFGLDIKAMKSHTRKRPVTTFRQLFIAAWRDQVYEPVKRTGVRLGRDHSTIIHAVNAVADWVSVDRKIARDFEGVVEIVKRHTWMLTVNKANERLGNGNPMTERIECPECRKHSDVMVTDFAPRLHFCQCGHTIMESEWQRVSGQLMAE